ncbi:TPA: hypothetical protein I7730_00655 [Vibrio vulnificus]|uniref:Uncharacterized protein n=1 Tax=Vibrio vulnificus TaxID=672 RepID=A0A8H9K563_VIBVL|nr:hypothetical protein [Vibrio vulnificus]
MRRNHPNTFRDIAKHSDKTVKLASYLAETGFKLLISKLGLVSDTTSPVEALEAFNADLTKTVTTLGQIHELLCTVQDNNQVLHLNNEVKDLSVLFGGFYDSSSKSIDLGGVPLRLKSEFKKDAYREDLIKSCLGLEVEQYELMMKGRKKLFDYDDQILETDEDKLSALAAKVSNKEYSPALDKVRQIASDFTEFRKSVSLSVRNLIDSSITYERAMIDSVVKTSTYISKGDGIEQVATSHKNQAVKIKKIVDYVNSNPYIEAIELDRDTDLDSVISALDQMSRLKMNMDADSKPAIFKVRKMGNYKVRGAYFRGFEIVAVDIEHPSSIVHEFAHKVDFSSALMQHPSMIALMSNLSSRLNYNELSQKYSKKFAKYAVSRAEVFARAMEVGYILSEYGYKDGEDINDFIERVKVIEATNDSPSVLSLVKNIEHYADDDADIYFDIRNMLPSELAQLRDATDVVFGIDGREPKQVNELAKIEKKGLEIKEKRAITRYEPQPTNLLNSENISELVSTNKEQKIMSLAAIVEQVFEKPTHISRSTLGYPDGMYSEQQATVKNFVASITEEQSSYIDYLILKTLYSIHKGEFNQKQSFAHLAGVVDGVRVGEQAYGEDNPEWGAKFSPVDKKYAELTEQFNNDRSNPEVRVELKAVRTERTEILDEMRKHRKEVLNSSQPRVLGDYNFFTETWHHSIKKSKGFPTTYFLNKTGIDKFCRPLVEHANKVFESPERLEAAIMHLKKDDALLYAFVSDQLLRQKFIYTDARIPCAEAIEYMMVKTGAMESMFENLDYHVTDVKLEAVPVQMIANLSCLKKFGRAFEIPKLVKSGELTIEDVRSEISNLDKKYEKALEIEAEIEGQHYVEAQPVIEEAVVVAPVVAVGDVAIGIESIVEDEIKAEEELKSKSTPSPEPKVHEPKEPLKRDHQLSMF